MASRKLDDLDPRFRPLAAELIARCIEARIPVLIVSTRRTPFEQAELLKAGRSWTLRSKHLRGMAIDIVPYDQYKLHGETKLKWDASDPVWNRLGLIGERIGLVWGGRWEQRDMGHFEYPSIRGNTE